MAALKPSDVQCPAGELTRGTLSHNRADVRCHADGMLLKAEGSPCVDCYTGCVIWKLQKESDWAHKKLGKPEMMHAGR